jgi:hypothetical protein
MNLSLKHALIDRRTPAYKTAFEADIHPNRLSRFITGLSRPHEEEKVRLAKVLELPVSELFPMEEVVE